MRKILLLVVSAWGLLSAWIILFAQGNIVHNLVVMVVLGSLAAALLTAVDAFRYARGRFSLATLLLILMLFALSFGAFGVLIQMFRP
jgi:hypothetical protein